MFSKAKGVVIEGRFDARDKVPIAIIWWKVINPPDGRDFANSCLYQALASV